jgi:hypothetical protein
MMILLPFWSYYGKIGWRMRKEHFTPRRKVAKAQRRQGIYSSRPLRLGVLA